MSADYRLKVDYPRFLELVSIKACMANFVFRPVKKSSGKVANLSQLKRIGKEPVFTRFKPILVHSYYKQTWFISLLPTSGSTVIHFKTVELTRKS